MYFVMATRSKGEEGVTIAWGNDDRAIRCPVVTEVLIHTAVDNKYQAEAIALDVTDYLRMEDDVAEMHTIVHDTFFFAVNVFEPARMGKPRYNLRSEAHKCDIIFQVGRGAVIHVLDTRILEGNALWVAQSRRLETIDFILECRQGLELPKLSEADFHPDLQKELAGARTAPRKTG